MLSKSAQSTQDVLSSSGVELKIVELSANTRTAAEAAGAPNAVFRLSSSDLEVLSKGSVVAIQVRF
jgi:hypothetical protein